jgi:hypothetical protein
MLTLSEKKIEAFVTRQQKLGNNVRWNGWTLEFFRPSEQAIYNVESGVFRDGQYGFLNRVEVNNDGHWVIDWRNVKKDRIERHTKKHI